MKQCKYCKHWIPPIMEKVSLGGKWGECDYIDSEGLIDVNVICDCGDIGGVCFFTHPDFGCISWEGK